MKILLIEPDIKVASAFSSALDAAGHTVTVAPGAQSAVYSSDESKPELVVLELQLVAHNGLEFIYEFRSYPEWQEIPIILLTMVPPSSLQISDAILTELGIVDCLYKPATSLKKLISVINELA